MPAKIEIIGGGLAGVEAAYRLAEAGVAVKLIEMRPTRMTPAHSGDKLGELVCSNSLKGEDPTTAHGLLKQELRTLGSLVLKVAAETSVPAGRALAVDRAAFAARLTDVIGSHPLIEIDRREITELDPQKLTIVASGPLSSPELTAALGRLTGAERLSFYDAVAPIVTGASVDMQRAFFGARWLDDSDDYLNCPLEKDEYEAFVAELTAADKLTARDFEDERYFEGCLPVEVIAERGAESLRYGGMRPIGFTVPHTGRRPYAVVQLRRENLKGDAYNLVGFQTRLKYPEQDRVFRLIPGLAKAEFLRYGSIHRNTFIDSPRVLNSDQSLKDAPNIYMAGQITGVEGYVESAMSGLLTGIAVLARLKGAVYTPPPVETACGALTNHITDAEIKKFQPMNINFGIMPLPDVHKKVRAEERLRRAAAAFDVWRAGLDL